MQPAFAESLCSSAKPIVTAVAAARIATTIATVRRARCGSAATGVVCLAHCPSSGTRTSVSPHSAPVLYRRYKVNGRSLDLRPYRLKGLRTTISGTTPQGGHSYMLHFLLAADTWAPYPKWLNPGDNAWQMTAATLVGLMSIPGLAVLYGGVMQKRWSVNSMMLSFVAFALVLIVWVLYGFKMGFGEPMHIFGASGGSFFANMWGKPATILGHAAEQGQAVVAAITPILMLGSVLGRINFKAWIPFVLLWSSLVYTVNAFLIWGGGFFSQHGAVDFSGGYVIHLAAGVSGF